MTTPLRSRLGLRLGFALLVPFACASLPAAAQDTYYVSSTAPSGAGSLPAAVAAMQVNGTTQTLRFLLPNDSVVTLGADLAQLTGTQVEVIGTDTPGLIIDGGGFRIFRYVGQSLVMRDVILRNGRSTGSGCLSSNATINTQVFDSQFLNCRTDGTLASGSSGGALFSFGSLRLTRTRFVGNQATDGGVNNLGMGGGAVAVTGSPVLIENSEFIDNITVRTPMPAGNCADGVGAALVADLPAGGVAGLSGVSFSNNSHRCGTPGGAISGQGGAISIFGPSSGAAPAFIVTGSYFGGNLADNGAGIFARAVALTLSNTSFYANVSRGAGAVFMAAGFGATPPAPELSVSSSTFRLNGTTGGIANFGADVSLSATAIVRQFRNVLLGAPQAGASCAPASFDADAGDVSFTTDDTCLAYVGGNLVTAQFGAGNAFGLQTPEFNGGPVLTLNLAPGSPAIDNGSNTGCPAFDARGVARPYDGDGNQVAICDVGAVEYVPNVILSDGFES